MISAFMHDWTPLSLQGSVTVSSPLLERDNRIAAVSPTIAIRQSHGGGNSADAPTTPSHTPYVGHAELQNEHAGRQS
jgi:hypothetical protein